MAQDSLEHFGIKGMHWGHRSAEKKIEKTAQKDAQRHLDAKMAYGKGAGTRRKLLKAEIDQKMKDPHYKKSFEDALETADRVKAVNRAKRWRHKEDIKDQAVRSTKQAAMALTGTTSVAAAGILYLRYKPQVDSIIKSCLARRV